MMQVKNISKTFGIIKKKKVLHNISFSLDANATLLIGQNGAGKSTLLNIINGTFLKSSGSVIGAGHVGLVNEKTTFPVGVSVKKYLRDLLVLSPQDDEQKEKIFHKFVKMLNISYLLPKKANKLSSGEKRKVALCRELIFDKKIILLDEPTANLDPLARKNLLKVIQHLIDKENKKILIASHNLDELEKFARQVLILHHGHLLYDGSLEELTKGKDLMDVFTDMITKKNTL